MSLLAPLLAGLLAASSAQAGALNNTVHSQLHSDAGWTLTHSEDGVQVYKKYIPAVGHTAWRGVMHVDASVDPKRIYAVVANPERMKRLNHAIAESKIVSKEGSVLTYYQVLEAPALVPISDRWWINRAIGRRNVDGSDRQFKRQWSSVPKGELDDVRATVASQYPRAVEIPQTHGSWQIMEGDDGGSLVIYTAVSDPGGGVPKSLAAKIAGHEIAGNIVHVVAAAK